MNDTSILIMLVDKSGSMSDIADDAIGSFNSFLEKQKQVPGEARMFVGLFDTKVSTYVVDAPIQDVPLLTKQTYSPGGMTALLDAIGMTITTVDSKIKGLNNPRVLLAVLTDGQENSSVEYNHPRITELLEEKKKQGWEILFLAAGLDAAQEASKLGFAVNKTAVFNKNSRNYNIVNDTLNAYTTAYRTTADPVQYSTTLSFAQAAAAAVDTGAVNSDFFEDLKKDKN